MTKMWTDDALAQLRRLVGDVDDETLKEITVLDPSWDDIEEAVMWVDGRIDASAGKPPPSGKVGQIAELLASAFEEEEPAAGKSPS